MRIRRLSLKNVGPFDDAVLEFPEPEGDGELVLFEGPNGSGKTTIAEAITLLINPTQFGPYFRRARNGWDARLTVEHEGSTLARGFGQGVGLHDDSEKREAVVAAIRERLNGLLVQTELSQEPNTKPTRWAAFSYHAHMADAKVTVDGPRPQTTHPLAGATLFGEGPKQSAELGQLLVNLEFERVQSALYAGERPADATRLRATAESRKRALQRLEKAFSHLLGRAVTFVFEPGQLSARMLFDGEEIPLHSLGEGMRSTVAWLSDLLVRLERISWADEARSPWEQEFWLILDEIEASLHPTLQMRLLPALRELFPRARIYATTHSPFVVASAGEGHVFCLQPDPKTHHVSGTITPVKLEPGQSLEWVVASIFGTPTGIIDVETRSAIEAHQREVDALRQGAEIDWSAFLQRRGALVALNDEVATIVRMAESPVRKTVEAKLRERAA